MPEKRSVDFSWHFFRPPFGACDNGHRGGLSLRSREAWLELVRSKIGWKRRVRCRKCNEDE
jgi:hypothetical protein